MQQSAIKSGLPRPAGVQQDRVLFSHRMVIFEAGGWTCLLAKCHGREEECTRMHPSGMKSVCVNRFQLGSGTYCTMSSVFLKQWFVLEAVFPRRRLLEA